MSGQFRVNVVLILDNTRTHTVTTSAPRPMNIAREKAQTFSLFALFEPLPGLEPGTYALRMRCSTN